MKKLIIYAALVILIMCLAAGCANKGDDTTSLGVVAINAMANNETSADDETPDDAEPQEAAESLSEGVDANVIQENNDFLDDEDIRFTSSSSDPAFEEFIDMLWENPEGYLNKSVSIYGQYMGWFDDYYDRYTHYIYKWDEMGCCPLMMEIRLNENVSPDDFPEQDAQIEITGVYKSYQEDNWDYYYVDVEMLSVSDGGTNR